MPEERDFETEKPKIFSPVCPSRPLEELSREGQRLAASTLPEENRPLTFSLRSCLNASGR
jgi:hypothetical protein